MGSSPLPVKVRYFMLSRTSIQQLIEVIDANQPHARMFEVKNHVNYTRHEHGIRDQMQQTSLLAARHSVTGD